MHPPSLPCDVATREHKTVARCTLESENEQGLVRRNKSQQEPVQDEFATDTRMARRGERWLTVRAYGSLATQPRTNGPPQFPSWLHTSTMATSKTILELDADVLCLILEFARAQGSLRMLSATCR